MFETNLQVEVHRLDTTQTNNTINRYRLYVNDDLLSERTWIWDFNTYILEDIWVSLPLGDNRVSIAPILDPSNQVRFGLKNFKLNTWPKPDLGGEQTELPFVLEQPR